MVGPWSLDGSTGLLFGIDSDDVAQKLAEFEGVWEVLLPFERGQLVNSLVERVVCSPDK